MLPWGRFVVVLDDVDLEPATLFAVRDAIAAIPLKDDRNLLELLALVNVVLRVVEPGLRSTLRERPDGSLLLGAERDDCWDVDPPP